MVLVRGLAVIPLLVGEVVLLVQRGKHLAGGRLPRERHRHGRRYPRQKRRVKQHRLDPGIGLLEDLAREVVEQNLR